LEIRSRLTQGTEQYPRENEYSEYLAKHSGASNAYTATTNTNYYFSVGPPALGGALARFAGFFSAPLFAPGCTTRELNAVDSEHKKNLQSDVWRIFQVNKRLSKPGHVWRKFGTGNRDTLEGAARELKRKGCLDTPKDSGDALRRASFAPSVASSVVPSREASPTPSENEADGGVVGRETRRRLVEWWEREYCASRMRLCVVGKGACAPRLSSVYELTHVTQTHWTSSQRWSYPSSHPS
jgi:insulysin